MGNNLLGALEWRCIGPHRGGRVVAVAGHPTDPRVFYFGSTGGGVWKTSDGGISWRNISDGYFRRASVGAIAVAPSDPNVIYVGMGECCIRGNVSHGDGVYRSTDGGRTWKHLGLEATQNIARVRVHPENPDLVYVAALGHVYGPNPERGIFRSTDGGRTWERVLFRDENTGAIDLCIDPTNPRILYAAFWQARRTPYSLISGGEGSGLFKSTDGGDTWVEITDRPGLPKGLKGRIGIAVSPARPQRVWAMIEAEEGGLYRSDDGGETWQRVNQDNELRQRAWYYMHIYADPRDEETVYVLNVLMWRSTDGGKTFVQIPTPHPDHHDLWIDPRDPERMILGCDGGATVTYNGGLSWSTLYNQPTAELYHVTTDTRFPYRVYGAQQDNTTISVPSRGDKGAIIPTDWEEVGGGESGYIAVRPDDPDIIFAGSYQGFLTRYNRRTRQARNIQVWPETTMGAGAEEARYRFQWTYPIVISPHDPNVLYVCGNHVFRSTDEGVTWERVSPDLTRNDPSKLGRSGGPITGDNTGAEYYCTIFAFAESPVERGVLWAGSDDGLIHISRDGGRTWENVTPPDLPEWALISIIEASPHEAGAAYVAATRYKLDDFRPYLYKTTDYGKTWTRITNGIPENEFTRVIREDPCRRGLLYAGTEAGIYVSFDDGASWHSLRTNLPVVPIHDLVIKDDDLVVATHGRSFWILDDVTILRQLADEVGDSGAASGAAATAAAAAAASAATVRLYRPRRTVRWRSFSPPWASVQAGEPGDALKYAMANGLVTPYYVRRRSPDRTEAVLVDAGQNPPEGVIVYYRLDRKPDQEVRMTIKDAAGNVLRTFRSKPDGEADAGKNQKESGKGDGDGPFLPAEPGLNRFVWDMRAEGPRKLEGAVVWGAQPRGPIVPPGAYQIELTVGDQTVSTSVELVADPRIEASQADLEAQYALLLRIRDRISDTHDAINRIRELKRQIEDWTQRAEARPGHAGAERIREAGKALVKRLEEVEGELIQVKAKSRQDMLNHPAKLNVKLVSLMGSVASADAAPTRAMVEVFEDLSARLDRQLQRLRELIETEVPKFNELVREAGIPPVAASDRPQAAGS